ncbi:MAG: tripartite tricarboxylate transporter substrate binding protein [Spirochaetaceae bacterium]|nr:tripartite tricarboxylate transporter substrate binding protein [Spirochaetaceae bacterium]
MKKQKRMILFLLVVLLIATPVLVSATGNKEAAKYPTRPVELLIPMGAGGIHDIGARAVVAVIQKYLGQPMIVTLRPGASGVVGTTEVANAPKDGYKLLSGGTGPNTAVPLVQDVPYNADSFVCIAQLSYLPVILVVPGNSPFNSVKDLIDYIKANPGKLNYATSGAYSNQHIPQGQLWHAAGVLGKITPIHFDGGGPQLAAILGGQCDVGTAFQSQLMDHVKAGKLKALAIADTRRLPASEADGVFKDVPTLQELGYNVVFGQWRTIMAPAGIPKDVELFLRDVFNKLCKDPAYIDLLKKIGEPTDLYLDGPDFKKFWDEERTRLIPFMKTLKEIEG